VIDKPLTVHSANGPQFTMIEGVSRTRCAFLQNGAFLAGFTLTNGNVGSSSGSGGGAASGGTSGSPPSIGGTFVNCTFANNRATGVPGFPVFQSKIFLPGISLAT